MLSDWMMHFVIAQMAHGYLRLALHGVSLFADERHQFGYRVQQVEFKGTPTVNCWTMCLRCVLVKEFEVIFSALVNFVLRLEDGVQNNF